MEENKVATRQSLHNAFENIGVKSDQAYRLADVILQSPDSRVTLVERPQSFRAFRHTDKLWEVQESRSGWWVAICTYEESCCAESAAKDYAAYLNSKEPK